MGLEVVWLNSTSSPNVSGSVVCVCVQLKAIYRRSTSVHAASKISFSKNKPPPTPGY